MFILSFPNRYPGRFHLTTDEGSPQPLADIQSRNGNRMLCLGDIIAPREMGSKAFLQALCQSFEAEKVLDTAGFYYLFHWQADARCLRILTNFGGILPVYFLRQNGEVKIASRVSAFADRRQRTDTRYLAERLLFHYPLTDRTFWSEVRRLPAHHMLIAEPGSLRTERYFDGQELFRAEPLPAKKQLPELSELFVREFRRYLPGEPFRLSFTAGFDGRTLLGTSHLYGHTPDLFSFGTAENEDILLPRDQAKLLHLRYQPILLDDPAYLNASFLHGQEMIRRSSGESSFTRSHYHYAAQRFAGNYKYLLTGNFGSELFRAFHNVGAMCSRWLYDLFQAPSLEDLAQTMTQAPELDLLTLDFPRRKEVVEDLLHDVSQQPWMTAPELDRNQRFYLFVFEEMFRKYFGAEILMQSDYLINRSPFLHFPFVRALYQTELAGAYSSFFEHNRFRRWHGQLFYANVLTKTFPKLANLPVGKGYRPRDLLTTTGKVRVAWGYFLRKSTGTPAPADPFGVRAAYEKNASRWRHYVETGTLFDPAALAKPVPAASERSRYTALSLAYFHHYLQQLKESPESTGLQSTGPNPRRAGWDPNSKVKT